MLFSYQAAFRSYRARKLFREELFNNLEQLSDQNKIDNEKSSIKSLDLFKIMRKLIFTINTMKNLREKSKKSSDDDEVNLDDPGYKFFEKLCKQTFFTSLFSSDPHYSYVGVPILYPKKQTEWKNQVIQITKIACGYLKKLRPEQLNHQGSIAIFLNILVSFTSISSWLILRQNEYDQYRSMGDKVCREVINELISNDLYDCLNDLLLRGLTRTKPSLKKLPLTALITISIRPLQNSSYRDGYLKKFTSSIFSIPALIHHLNSIAPEAIQILYREPILRRLIEFLRQEDNAREIFSSLEGNYTLCLLANLIHFAFISHKSINPFMVDFVLVIKKTLESCQKYVISKQSSTTHWHPVLGWFSQNVDQR